MSGHSVALPRLRARRRRRRPMPPYLRFLLGLLTAALASICWCVIGVMIGDPFYVLPGLVNVFSTHLIWPTLKREWDAWRDGE